MKIRDLANMCLGGSHNTVSVERSLIPGEPTESLFSGKFDVGVMPVKIADMEFKRFSVKSTDRSLRADIVIYIS